MGKTCYGYCCTRRSNELSSPSPPTKRDGGVGRIPREKPRSLRFWRSIWRRGPQPHAPKEGPQMEHRKTRIKISLVVFGVRSVFNPWLKVGLEFFATLPNPEGVGKV